MIRPSCGRTSKHKPGAALATPHEAPMTATQHSELFSCAETTRVQLLDEHVEDLRKSGLSDDTIAEMKTRSLTAVELEAALSYVPHRAGCRPDRVRSALALPYLEVDFTRYKLFPPALDANGHEQRYVQRKDSGVHLYVLPAVRAVLTDARVPLYYTEGEKKAAKATQEGFQCIGLGGLWNFLEAGTANGIAELDAIVHVEREEIIVPDADVWRRPELLRPVYALGKELEARGAKETLPPAMLNSMGEAWRKKQENLEALKKETVK
jgi:hypothetical protein